MSSLIRRGPHLQIWRKFCMKKSAAVASEPVENRKDTVSFDNFKLQRQKQAKRSIVVQVSSEKSFPELYNYCSAFGNIMGAYHYFERNEEELHYILLQFATDEEATAAIESGCKNDEFVGVPSRSSFLWFKAGRNKRPLKLAKNTKLTKTPVLDVVEGTRVLTTPELNSLLQPAENIENQIHILHESTKLSDLGVRLRFLAALQVQQTVIGLFPEANAQPFGSSVNGFGKMGCDLDLILRFDREQTGQDANKHNNSRLVFHTKENLSNGRSQTQRQMETIGDMLYLFVPGVSHVRRILQARVPIIKYHHDHLNLEVDLSMSNLTGSYMSELFYMFGEIDERVRPLVFCVRRWASTCGLTNPSPGRWITNFSLTCLVLFFLQQLKQPLLPTVGTLMRTATPDDLRLTEDGLNCTFGRDLNSIGFITRNRSKVHELLLQFFEYYSQFDFNNRAISLNEGRPVSKPDHAALYIINPLETVLNVSKNVSLEECERLRIEVRNAAWVLESELESAIPSSSSSETEKNETPWGLLNLFKTPESAIVRPNMFYKPRMVEVSDLFEKTDETTNDAIDQTNKNDDDDDNNNNSNNTNNNNKSNNTKSNKNNKNNKTNISSSSSSSNNSKTNIISSSSSNNSKNNISSSSSNNSKTNIGSSSSNNSKNNIISSSSSSNNSKNNIISSSSSSNNNNNSTNNNNSSSSNNNSRNNISCSASNNNKTNISSSSNNNNNSNNNNSSSNNNNSSSNNNNSSNNIVPLHNNNKNSNEIENTITTTLEKPANNENHVKKKSQLTEIHFKNLNVREQTKSIKIRGRVDLKFVRLNANLPTSTSNPIKGRRSR